MIIFCKQEKNDFINKKSYIETLIDKTIPLAKYDCGITHCGNSQFGGRPTESSLF